MDTQTKIRCIALKQNIKDEQEIQQISSIFSDEAIQVLLSKTEMWRKIKIGIYLIITILVIYLIIRYANTGNFQITNDKTGITRPSNIYDGILVSIFPFLFFTFLLNLSFRSRLEKNLKEIMIERFLKILQPNAKYSPLSTYSFPLGGLKKGGLLSSYDRIDFQEDSMEFSYLKNGKSLNIQGMELRTSELRGKKKKKRVITNHCYLIRGEYPETRFKIEKDVLIKTDMADSNLMNLAYFLVPTLVASMITFSKEFTSETNIGGIVTKNVTHNQLSDYPILAGIISIAIGYFVWYGIRFFINRKRIKLENVAFEKLFDVRCDDPILSRMVITPAIMDRLVQFVQKMKGKYEFLFQGNTIYIKKILPKRSGYMEVSGWRNIKTNVGMFLQRYSDLKEIVSLVSDTGVLVFAKTEAVLPGTGKIETSESLPILQTTPIITIS